MIAAELINHCQQEIHRQKNSIIDKIRSSEINLVKNIKLNPKLWNKECLDIKIDRSKPDKINIGLSAIVKVYRPDAVSAAPETSQASADHNKNLSELVRHLQKDQEENIRQIKAQREKRRNETRRERQEREWRDHVLRVVQRGVHFTFEFNLRDRLIRHSPTPKLGDVIFNGFSIDLDMSHHDISLTSQRIELRNSWSELPSGLSLRFHATPPPPTPPPDLSPIGGCKTQ